MKLTCCFLHQLIHCSIFQHELLLVAEFIKVLYSAWMISGSLPESTMSLTDHLSYLVRTSRKMIVLALMYGAMNILSFVSLRNISAAMFSIFAQCKILTTAACSTLILKQKYSWTKWRALISLMLGVFLFSEPMWRDPNKLRTADGANIMIGTASVLVEVTLSGFASIYFEKAIKTDPLQLNIWERNFQLAVGSFPVYLVFIAVGGGGEAGHFGGWSWVAVSLACLGAAGGLLVALSIKHGDSILKTLATTGAIILSSFLDHAFLGGPLTPSMMIAGAQVIISIINYTFDATHAFSSSAPSLQRSGTPSKGYAAPRDDMEQSLLLDHSDHQSLHRTSSSRSTWDASGP
jgi:solute carrier family 35 (UDP-sugar transporter), member A1/2/3